MQYVVILQRGSLKISRIYDFCQTSDILGVSQPESGFSGVPAGAPGIWWGVFRSCLGVSESLVTQKMVVGRDSPLLLQGGFGLVLVLPCCLVWSWGLLGPAQRGLGFSRKIRRRPKNFGHTRKVFLATFLVFLRLLLCGVSSSGTAAAKKGGFFKLF